MKYYVITVAAMLLVLAAGCRSQRSATSECLFEADTLSRRLVQAAASVSQRSDVELVIDSIRVELTDGSVATARRASLRRHATGEAKVEVVVEQTDSAAVSCEDKREQHREVRREHSRSLPWLAVVVGLVLIGLSYVGIRLRR